jgi:hypothetical protein
VFGSFDCVSSQNVGLWVFPGVVRVDGGEAHKLSTLILNIFMVYQLRPNRKQGWRPPVVA